MKSLNFRIKDRVNIKTKVSQNTNEKEENNHE